MSDFETLIKKNDICYNDRWSPNLVSTYEYNLSQGTLKGLNHDLRKNIAYSLQYLEYIELQLHELDLHNVIITMLYKTFIITGVSIIEGVFYYLLKSNNLWTQKEWELEKIVKSNGFSFENETRKVETHIFKSIPKTDDEMNLDSMIKKIESHSLIDIPHQAFPYLKKLKRLRNKVHLQINEHPNDTDWWSFNYSDYLWMKYILFKILTNSKFGLDDENIKKYSFIALAKGEIQTLRKEIDKSPEEKDNGQV
ncbi:hypothetical protein [Caproiciproducens faecalis]|uniref:Uncharacterized protein n=1 Tax=Caproiciproducens faecalis TaxID=2820301 RepID=A0ABS7DPK7_9FIRM|nr:hypothetical protein [Caproiciproducens faecalis]MBW7572491.1 hypothetical protein [Caproiciproducens faecalis]